MAQRVSSRLLTSWPCHSDGWGSRGGQWKRKGLLAPSRNPCSGPQSPSAAGSCWAGHEQARAKATQQASETVALNSLSRASLGSGKVVSPHQGGFLELSLHRFLILGAPQQLEGRGEPAPNPQGQHPGPRPLLSLPPARPIAEGGQLGLVTPSPLGTR